MKNKNQTESVTKIFRSLTANKAVLKSSGLTSLKSIENHFIDKYDTGVLTIRLKCSG